MNKNNNNKMINNNMLNNNIINIKIKNKIMQMFKIKNKYKTSLIGYNKIFI